MAMTLSPDHPPNGIARAIRRHGRACSELDPPDAVVLHGDGQLGITTAAPDNPEAALSADASDGTVQLSAGAARGAR